MKTFLQWLDEMGAGDTQFGIIGGPTPMSIMPSKKGPAVRKTRRPQDKFGKFGAPWEQPPSPGPREPLAGTSRDDGNGII